jgi:DNA excision repair protein ERCC-4
VDTREPWPHPWQPYFSDSVELERGTLETGDLALAKLPDGAVIERKTVPDLLGVIGKGRERFERELKRSRYVGRFLVVVEGTLADVLAEARSIHPISPMSSIGHGGQGQIAGRSRPHGDIQRARSLTCSS